MDVVLWQVSGPTDVSEYLKPTAQLFLPKNVLKSDSVYTVAVKVCLRDVWVFAVCCDMA